MKYAILDGGVVINIVVSNRPLSASWVAIPIGCPAAIGDKYVNGCFYAPDETMRMSPEQMISNQKIAEQAAEIESLKADLVAAQEANDMLTECVLEMSAVVYA